MKKYYFIALLCIIPALLSSQNRPLKWKKLSKEEIELKEYPEDPYASAVILYDFGETYFDLNPNGSTLFLFYTGHFRLKILKEEGLKFAKFKIPYSDMTCEQLQKELSYSIKAVLHNINESNQPESKKLKPKFIKSYDSVNCQKILELNFPEAKVGSILEIKYKIPSLDLVWPRSWVFQKHLPVMNSEFRFRIPRDFQYLFSIQNESSEIEIDSSYYNQTLMYKNSRNYYGRYRSNRVQHIDLSGIEYRFKSKNIQPAYEPVYAQKINLHLSFLRARPDVIGYEALTRSLMITLHHDYEKRNPSQRSLLSYPAPYILYNQKNWQDVNERLLKDEAFNLALYKFWDTDSIINELINESQSLKEKASVIYNYVRNHMKWNKTHSLFADVSDRDLVRIYSKINKNVKLNNLGDFWKKGEGSSAEINFVLMYLLSKAGLEVTPVLCNTIDRHPVDKGIPEVRQFKTVLAMVNTDSGKILLDAADPESNFTSIAEKYQKTLKYSISRDNNGWIE